MDIRAVLKQLVDAFVEAEIPYALIGGLALGPHGAGRGTQDIDMLVDGTRADEVDALLTKMGYRRLHRNDDVANFLSDDPERGRVDFLFAQRPPTQRMLATAQRYQVLGWPDVPVVDVEDLIGLKVQGYSNNSRRYHLDIGDIQRLIEGSPELDLERVRDYFRTFDREKDLEDILSRRRK